MVVYTIGDPVTKRSVLTTIIGCSEAALSNVTAMFPLTKTVQLRTWMDVDIDTQISDVDGHLAS